LVCALCGRFTGDCRHALQVALGEQLRLLRADPSHFAALIQKRVPLYNDEGYLVIGRVAWSSVEGRSAAIDAVQYLNSLVRVGCVRFY
jgi:hypothetical protein